MGMVLDENLGTAGRSGMAGASAAAASSSTQPTLPQAAEILKGHLGLEGNVADVVKQAAGRLGVAANLPLMPMAQQCLQILGVTS